MLAWLLDGLRPPQRVHASAGIAALPAPRTVLPVRRITPRMELRKGASRLIATAAGIALAAIGGIALATAAITAAIGSRSGVESANVPAVVSASVTGGALERSFAQAVPSGNELGALAMAAAEEEHRWNVLRAMVAMSEHMKAEQAARAAAARAATAPPPGAATTLNRASGYAPGTVLNARITIYGCTGPGGGFCGNMASGVRVFEGAAACSHDLPFGTRFIIHGDATGRVYECLDRGALKTTWVDVFFYNTTAGINWASNLGGTVAPIEIVN